MKLKERKKDIIIICIILIVICIDQIIKITIEKNVYNSSIPIIKGVLNFSYVENTGGAFGIGSNGIITFIIINIIIIGLLFKFILSRKDQISIYTLISIILVIAGGLGNLIDRIFRGFVIDYIDINPIIKYPMFNFADICIVIGCILIIINLINNIIKDR